MVLVAMPTAAIKVITKLKTMDEKWRNQKKIALDNVTSMSVRMEELKYKRSLEKLPIPYDL